jgi:hypothetical protein
VGPSLVGASERVSVRQHEAINDLIRAHCVRHGSTRHLAAGFKCSRCNLTERVADCDENT